MDDLGKILTDTTESVKKGGMWVLNKAAAVGGALTEPVGITKPEPSYGKAAPGRKFDTPSGPMTFDSEGKATPVAPKVPVPGRAKGGPVKAGGFSMRNVDNSGLTKEKPYGTPGSR